MSEESPTDKIPDNYTGGVLSKAPKPRSAKHFRIRCCVPGCSSRDNVKGISFHRLPKIKKINKLWKIKCRLIDKIPETYTVCSKHFLPSDYQAGEYRHVVKNKLLLKTAVPSQNLPDAPHSRKKNKALIESRAKRLENRNAKLSTDKLDPSPKVDQSIVVKTEGANNKVIKAPKFTQVFIKQESIIPTTVVNPKPTKLGISARRVPDQSTVDNPLTRINVMDLLITRNKLNAWTGVQTFSLLRKIEKRVSLIHPNKIEGSDLSLLECIVLCFIRLKTKLSFICLTSIFNISTSSISKIFNTMLPLIRKALDDVDYFSSTINSEDNQPITLRMYGYNEALAILDSSEGDVQNSLHSNCGCSCGKTDTLSETKKNFQIKKSIPTVLRSPKLEHGTAVTGQ